jgi:hypothetical protein
VPTGAGATALAYPKNGNVLRVAAARADLSGCAHGTQHETATSSLRQLTLFGGAIRAGRLVVESQVAAARQGEGSPHQRAARHAGGR